MELRSSANIIRTHFLNPFLFDILSIIAFVPIVSAMQSGMNGVPGPNQNASQVPAIDSIQTLSALSGESEAISNGTQTSHPTIAIQAANMSISRQSWQAIQSHLQGHFSNSQTHLRNRRGFDGSALMADFSALREF
jgi:hypothetical protein